MKIQIQRLEHGQDLDLPEYLSDGAVGMDLRAAVTGPTALDPWQRQVVPTGIAIALPRAYEGQIRPRSGLAAKHGITVLNTPGTVDSDYRGELKAILINLSDEPYEINRGDRIAQLVLSPVMIAERQEVDQLPQSARGHSGLGSTGG